jgi:hypothetical protein
LGTVKPLKRFNFFRRSNTPINEGANERTPRVAEWPYHFSVALGVGRRGLLLLQKIL